MRPPGSVLHPNCLGQRAQLIDKLSSYSGKQVSLEEEIDPEIKAGFVAHLGDQVFDGTLEAQLSRIRRQLAGGT